MPDVLWKSGCTDQLYATIDEAVQSYQQCSSPCVQYGGATQVDARNVLVGATIYQVCNLPDTIEQPFYQWNTGIVAASPGCRRLYNPSSPGDFYDAPEYIFYPYSSFSVFGECIINVVVRDQSLKPCATCVGNPIEIDTRAKIQSETDYDRSTGCALL